MTTTRKPWPAAAGGLAAVLGLLTLAGWMARRMYLVRVFPGAVPMQCDAAACFLLCGAGLAALAVGRRRPAAALGAAAAALACWSILRAVLGADFGLERLLVDASLRDAVPQSLRMVPLSSLAFLLAGGALLSRAVSSRRTAASAELLTGAALAAFGSVVVACYLTGIASAFGWDYLTRVPPQSGFGFAVLGAGLLGRAWPRRGADAADSRWLPAAAGVGAATAALLLWTALRVEQRVRIQYHVDAAAADLSEKIRTLQGPGRRGAALRPEQLFGTVLRARTPSTYAFAVYLGRAPVYTSPDAPEPRPEKYARDVEVRLGGEAGWIRVWPSAELLRVESSRLPAAVGAVGLILAFLLAWSIRLAQLARRQAREIASASAAKSRFLANISREFGNPLNAINGFAHVLMSRQDGELTAEQEQDLRAILAGGRRMASLMKELLQLAQLESGAVAVSLAAVSGGELMEDLRRQFEASAAENGLRLRVEPDARAGAVRADPERLRQALAYLVANAVKFASRGDVVLEQRTDGGEAVFRVSDSGAGISPEEMGHIFEPFWQSPRMDGVKKTEGLGLGLFLAKRLVELQGGTVAAEAAAGRGTTFAVRLPRAPASEPGGRGA